MKIRDLFYVNPIAFVSIIIVKLLTPALAILGAQIGIYQANAVQQVNLMGFLKLTILSFVLLVASYLVKYLFDYVLARQKEHYKTILRAKIVTYLCDTKKSYTISQIQNYLTNDLVQSEENYLDAFFELIGGAGYIISVLVLLFSIHWSLVLIISLMVIGSLFLPKIVEKPLQKALMGVSDSNKKYLDTIAKWLTGVDELRRYFSGSHLFRVLSKSGHRLEQANIREVSVNQCLRFANEVVSQLMLLALYAMTGYLIVSKRIAFGVIAVVSDLKYYLSSGVEDLSEARGLLGGVVNLNQRIENLTLPISEERMLNAGGKEVAKISTSDLQVNFPNGESLCLPDIKIEPGEKILLTGESGAGKTTLLKILAGELKPSSGRVIYADRQGGIVDPDLSTIAYLPQDAVLFPVNLVDNVTMFADQLASKVPQLIKKMQLQRDIDEHKLNLTIKIDLNKINVSGGQRQKIVLARALIHKSSILLIDEGTSAIDVQATIKILREIVATDASVVFIAHNLTQEMKQLFDHEIYLRKGRNARLIKKSH